MTTPPSSPDSAQSPSGKRNLETAAAAVDTPDIQLLREELQAAVGREFTLAECLGRGGMGAVFRARQDPLDRDVAIKVMLPSGSIPRAVWIERFQREARALAGLSHPGIVGVYSFGQTEQLAWIVMESVDGTSLRELMAQGQLTPAEALGLAPEICRAIQYAHDQGVVHRDIKPENVLVNSQGQVKLVDFGLAKLMQAADGTRMTSSSEILGTLRYMAPEQLDSPQEVDHRADIFSAGVVIYEMLTGKVPQGVIEPPSRRVQVDVRVDEVVLRTLEREPEHRYQAAGEVARRMDEIERDPLPGTPHDPGKPQTDFVAKQQAQPDERDARRGQAKLGRRCDRGLVILTLALFGSAWGTMDHLYGLGTWTLGVGFAMTLAMGVPAMVGSLLRPSSTAIQMPFVRLAPPFLGILVLVLAGFSLDSGAIQPDGMGALGILPHGLVWLLMLPFILATLTSLYPIGLQWNRQMARGIVVLGIVVALAAVASGAAPWSRERNLFQLLFQVGFALLGLMMLFGSKLHAPYRVDKASALGMSIAGPVGVSLVLLARPDPASIDFIVIACFASITIGFLGGLLGAGTHVQKLAPPQ